MNRNYSYLDQMVIDMGDGGLREMKGEGGKDGWSDGRKDEGRVNERSQALRDWFGNSYFLFGSYGRINRFCLLFST